MESKKSIVGIDPGITGAVAIHWSNNVITIEDTPNIQMKKAGGKMKTDYMPAEMVGLLKKLDPENTHVFIESVHSMPGQGVSSTFGFGKGFGIWIGILAALGLPYTFVTPQAWKKKQMLGMQDKDAARIRAQQMYPAAAPMLMRKKDCGRADALLIMDYGRWV